MTERTGVADMETVMTRRRHGGTDMNRYVMTLAVSVLSMLIGLMLGLARSEVIYRQVDPVDAPEMSAMPLSGRTGEMERAIGLESCVKMPFSSNLATSFKCSASDGSTAVLDFSRFDGRSCDVTQKLVDGSVRQTRYRQSSLFVEKMVRVVERDKSVKKSTRDSFDPSTCVNLKHEVNHALGH